MEFNLTIDELKEIAKLFKQHADYYEYCMKYAEDEGEYEYLTRRREENIKEYFKFWDAYTRACEEAGELPF